MESTLLAKIYVSSLIERKRQLYPGTLEPYGRKVYSQTDEDGILEEILYRTNICPGHITFIEIGVGGGVENNTLKLLGEGARGVWGEGDRKKAMQCAAFCQRYIKANQLLLISDMISRDNISQFTSQCVNFLGTDSPTVFSIDIDGPDYDVVECILDGNLLRPLILVCEYNGRLGALVNGSDDYKSMAHLPKDQPHLLYGTGSSLVKWNELLKGEYILVACGILGINAFFLRKDLYSPNGFPNTRIRDIYNPLDLSPWIAGGFKQLHGFPSNTSIY
jgi:hypothetical protein